MEWSIGRIGEPIHPGTVVDLEGKPVEGDSGEALKKIRSGTAALTTLGGIGEALGGYKGYGFALAVEMMSSCLQDGWYGKDLDGILPLPPTTESGRNFSVTPQISP